MLYEKTLNRKILGAKQKVNEDDLSNGNANGETNHANGETDHANGEEIGHANGSAQPDKAWHSSATHFFRMIWNYVRTIFLKQKQTKSKPEVEKDAASMGKILNLMR